MLNKSDIAVMPEYFDRYINLVEDENLLAAFENSINFLENLDIQKLTQLKDKTYEAEKWTINEIVQHITDIERLLTAGVLRFARGENFHIISFNEDEMAKNSKANHKNISKIISELVSVRTSTFELFKTFDSEDLQKVGINWKYEISVLAMGFNIVGHQIHHFNIIKERYWNL